MSICSVAKIYKVKYDGMTISNSIIAIIIMIGFFYIINKSFTKLNKRLLVIALIISLIFACFIVIGVNTYKFSYTQINLLTTWVKIIFLMPLLFSSIVLLFDLLFNYNKKRFIQNKYEKFEEKYLSGKKYFFIVWALIFIAWILPLLASYPGIYAYDSIFQMNYYLNGTIYLHHPLIHTYILGFFVETLGKIFGSHEIGMLFYSIFQMLFLSATFAVIYMYLKKCNVLFFIRILFLIIFMFFPINPLMSFSSTKDVIFSALICLTTLLLLRLADNNDLIRTKKFWISFCIISFFMIIFRSQGIYIYIFTAICTVILIRKQWTRLISLLLIPIILFGIYSGPVTKALNGITQPGNNIKEMMSVPCIQLSRALLLNENELTKVQKKQIKEFIPNSETYTPSMAISDALKKNFNVSKFRKNPIEFLKLYINVGIKCPLSYIDSWARLTIGLWYPDMNYRDNGAYHPYWEYKSSIPNKIFKQKDYLFLKRKSLCGLEPLSDFYTKLTYQNSYQKIPVLSMLFSSGILIWIVLLFMAWCIYIKNYKMLFPVSLVFALWLTLLLGPVLVYRYIYPITMTIPLLVGWVLKKNNNIGDVK